jgi:phosphomethylpyrimidine synthase
MTCYIQDVNPREGLPKLRAQWVASRDAAGDTCQTQMYYARQGVVTPEMAFVAARENMDPEFVRSEVS